MKKIKLLIIWIGLITLIVSSVVYGLTFIGDFSQGIFQNTVYNGSALKLTSGSLTGFYISSIFDASNTANWISIAWSSTEIGEISNNQQSNLSKGNVLLYHLNEQSGTIIDYSGMGNNGSYNGNLYIQTGKLNTAIGFDGVNDYVNTSSLSNFAGTNKISNFAWVYATKYPSSDGLTISTQQWLFYLQLGPSGYLRAYLYGTSNPGYHISNSTVSLNTWHHVGYTYNGSSVIFYIDGVQSGTISDTGNMGWGGGTQRKYSIGGENSDGFDFRYFNGSIDEVAVWNRTLSSSEILNLYKRGTLRLNLSVQSCNDSLCSSTNWTNLGSNLTSPQNLNVANNSYFQYKFYFETTNSTYSPEVYNLSIEYFLINQTNKTENPPDQNPSIIEGGPTNSTNTYDINGENSFYSLPTKDLSKKIISIVLIVLTSIALILFLIYLILKVVK